MLKWFPDAYKQNASILVIGLVRKILRESPFRTVPIQGFSNWIAIRSRSRKSGSRTGSGIEDRGPAHHWGSCYRITNYLKNFLFQMQPLQAMITKGASMTIKMIVCWKSWKAMSMNLTLHLRPARTYALVTNTLDLYMPRNVTAELISDIKIKKMN